MKVRPHGKVKMSVRVYSLGYQTLHVAVSDAQKIKLGAVTDTEAQMFVAGPQVIQDMNLPESELFQSAMNIKVANEAAGRLMGAFFAWVEGENKVTEWKEWITCIRRNSAV